MGKVLRFSGIGDGAGWGDGYVQFDFTAVTEVYVTFDIRLTAEYITYVAANPFSSEILELDTNGGTFAVDYLFIEESGGQGKIYIQSAANSFGTLNADTWYTVEFRVKNNGGDAQQLWIDGTLLHTGAVSTSGTDIGRCILGLYFTSEDNADQQYDIDNVFVGTTQGGGELLETDFEDDSIVPPFSSITDASGTGDSVFIFEEAEPPGPPQGISIAFDDTGLTFEPTWTRIDDTDPGGYQIAAAFDIERGRESELEKTDAGTATIDITDLDGILDPTNAGGPYFNNILPGKQAAIAIKNPVTDAWKTIFRGHVDQLNIDMDVSGKVQWGRLELVDLMGKLARTEMALTSPPTWGDAPLTSEPGTDIYFAEDTGLDACQTRINSVLVSAGIPSGLRSEIFTGNVGLQRAVYARNDQALSVCLDVADAEFPGVANFYINREGIVTFHGRYARFNPEDVQYNIANWQCGDAAAAADDPDVIPIAALSYRIAADDVVNAAVALPQAPDISEDEVAGQTVTDPTSIAEMGTYSISLENLLTHNGEGPTTAVEETHKMAEYYTDNMAQPVPRVTSIVIRPVAVTHPNATKLWKMMTEVDISDLITLYTQHPGGGGFGGDEYFVESVRYEARPMAGDIFDITLTLGLSPRARFAINPWDVE